jgi:hypothetical protein
VFIPAIAECRKLKQVPIEEPTAFTPAVQPFVLQDVDTEEWDQRLLTAVQNNDVNEFGATLEEVGCNPQCLDAL